MPNFPEMLGMLETPRNARNADRPSPATRPPVARIRPQTARRHSRHFTHIPHIATTVIYGHRA
jgi:hypothetical protein